MKMTDYMDDIRINSWTGIRATGATVRVWHGVVYFGYAYNNFQIEAHLPMLF